MGVAAAGAATAVAGKAFRKVVVPVAAATTLALGFVVVVLDDGGTPAQAASACVAPGTSAGSAASSVPGSTVAGFDGEQMKNAAAIMKAAEDLKLPVAAQLIGVQAAIGESTLRVIDFGDGAGPDSRGLFQQRANGSWGSYEDRMDPHASATNFFKALQNVQGWATLEPPLPSTARSGTRIHTTTPGSGNRPRRSLRHSAGSRLPWWTRPGCARSRETRLSATLPGSGSSPCRRLS